MSIETSEDKLFRYLTRTHFDRLFANFPRGPLSVKKEYLASHGWKLSEFIFEIFKIDEDIEKLDWAKCFLQEIEDKEANEHQDNRINL